MPGVMFAGFANRNSTGLFFVACLTLALLLEAPRPLRWMMTIRAACAAIFVVVIFLTQSRSAIVVAALPIALATARWGSQHRLTSPKLIVPGRRKTAVVVLAAIVGGAALVWAAQSVTQGRIGTAIERFHDGAGSRIGVWEDSLYSAERYFPVGAGMGTFDEVFQVDESLEHISPRKAGRAHNDYLELNIEAGIFGLLLLAAWIALLGSWSWRSQSVQTKWQAWAGSTILAAFALQSLTDYPARNQTLLVILAFAVVVLGKFNEHSKREAR